MCETSEALNVAFPSLRVKLDREVYFVTTQELEDRWPDKTPKERGARYLRPSTIPCSSCRSAAS